MWRIYVLIAPSGLTLDCYLVYARRLHVHQTLDKLFTIKMVRSRELFDTDLEITNWQFGDSHY